MKREIIKARAYQEIYSAVIQAAENIDLQLKEDKEEYLRFHYAGNFFTFGNEINVIIETQGSEDFILIIESSSAAAIQLIDWGQNQRLEEELLSEIYEQLDL